MATWERLGATDRIFLDMETLDAHLHVAGCFLFDARPLQGPHGGVDFERIQAWIASRLHRIPRYRQRIQRIPIEGDPIWVDDPGFNLQYHLRHTRLPPPGDDRQLKRLCGRVVSQLLDRGKPLWEIWVVDGLEDDRFALVTKIHHCLTDGIGGVELLGHLLSIDPIKDFEPAPVWIPRPNPDRAELARDAIRRRLGLPFEIGRGLANALRHPQRAWDGAAETWQGLREAGAHTVHPAADTPINGRIGSHRRFDWLAIDFDEIREIKHAFGGTVNDIALATATGAFGRFLERRGLPAREQRQLDFRAACPVNVREDAERGALGNRVANLIVRVPLGESDPVARLEKVREAMDAGKHSSQLSAMGAIERIGELTHPGLLAAFARLNVERRSSNFVFTNVPGPRTRWHLLEAPLLAAYPVVPLLPNHGVDIALMSYAGGLYWGFNSDWEQLPDLHDLVLATQEAFDELLGAARACASESEHGDPAEAKA